LGLVVASFLEVQEGTFQADLGAQAEGPSFQEVLVVQVVREALVAQEEELSLSQAEEALSQGVEEAFQKEALEASYPS